MNVSSTGRSAGADVFAEEHRLHAHDVDGRQRSSELLSSVEARSTDPLAGAAVTHSRFDPITGNWTIFAAARTDRPNEFGNPVGSSNAPLSRDCCPFCPGNEEHTPAAVWVSQSAEASGRAAAGHDQFDASDSFDATQPFDAVRSYARCAAKVGTEAERDSAGVWSIRVVPNKYPAVDPPECLSSPGHTSGRQAGVDGGFFVSRPIVGGHEVFIESRNHDDTFLDLGLHQVTTLLRAYQDRLSYWRSVPEVRYLSLFKNEGSSAGASLRHSHSQLIATSELPIAAKTVIDRTRRHHAKTGCCLQCDIIRAEIKANQRVVALTDSLIAYCPFASRLPMLLRITTKRHLDCFESLDQQELEELARLIRRSVQWIATLYPSGAYNFLIHTRPPAVNEGDASHWAFEIFPRVTQVAGFEWSSDCMINPTLPESAAASLRRLAIRENPLRMCSAGGQNPALTASRTSTDPRVR